MSSFPCKPANEKLVQEPIKTGSEWAQMLSFAGKSFKVAIIYMFKELKKNFFFKLKKKKLETQQIEAILKKSRSDN